MNGVDEAAFTRLFRSRCSVCGSDRLSWGSVGDEAARLHDDGQDSAAWVGEVAQGLGMVVGPALLSLDVWRCGDCGELGVFGPVEVGP